MAAKKPQGLARGLTNYGDAGFSLYLRRSFAKSMGYSGEMLARLVVGIADSKSGFNNCHRHFPELIEAVKRGVLAAGNLLGQGLGFGQMLQKQIGQTGIPVYNVTNACATGATALRTVLQAIAPGKPVRVDFLDVGER